MAAVLMIFLCFLYTIYHIQAYTLPLPLNPIKIGIFVPIHHIYCFMLAVCVMCWFIIHKTLQ